MQPAAYQAPRAGIQVGRSAAPAQAQGPSGPSSPAQGPTATRPEIADPALAREGGVLTPKGALVLEPSFEYAYTSNNRVLIEGITIVPGITIGTTDIREVNRRTYTTGLAARLGITDRLEVDAKVPYVSRSDTTTIRTGGNDRATEADGSDIGDIEIGAHYQLNSGRDGWPFLVANLRYKARTGRDPFEVPLDPSTGLELELPTGTGFDTVEPSLTAIYPSDPVVFFANARYIWNIARDVTIQGTNAAPARSTEIDPGDGVGLSVGMGFGINEATSFSLGYEHVRVLETKQGGQGITGSDYDIGSFLLGLSYRFSPRTSLNFGVAIGATEAAPDARIGVRVPVRFDLF